MLLGSAGDGGGPGAYLKLHGAYEKKLYAVAARVLGDPAEAEDAVQQTWLRAHPPVGPGEPAPLG